MVTVDDTLCTRVRDAVRTLREAEFAVREAVAALDASDVVALSGYRSTVRLVGDLARVDQVVAKRWVGQAKLVSERVAFSGDPLEPGLPATAAVFAEGTVGADHVRVIERAMDAVARVPDLGPDVVVDAEAMLAAHATQLCPRGVERAATRLLAHLDPDGVAPLDPPGLEDEVSVSTSRRDGSLALAARIHGAGDAELIREVLDALSVPAGPDDSRPVGARRAEALLELFTQAAAPTGIAEPEPAPDVAPDPQPEEPVTEEPVTEEPVTEEPVTEDVGPVSTPGRPLLTVTIDHEWLRLQVGHGLLDSDAAISPGEARRLACDAGIVSMVLGSRSQPLDVGRLSYTIPDGMRRAVHARDRGCTFPGCTRRPRRCQVHHARHWIDGGPTQLDNLTLQCRFHHQLIHHDQWEIHMREGRPWFVPPAWIDPTRTPRPGGPHPPEL